MKTVLLFRTSFSPQNRFEYKATTAWETPLLIHGSTAGIRRHTILDEIHLRRIDVAKEQLQAHILSSDIIRRPRSPPSPRPSS